MLAGTHTLLPVCACLVLDNLAVRSGRDRIFPLKSLLLVGLFGTLPDICTPHMSLEDRLTSWSHTVWFMAGIVPFVAMAGGFFEKGYRIRVALACWIASFLHLAADAISGGIAWLYPWRPDVLGKYWIPAQHWMWFDAFFILFTWFLVRIVPHLEARNIHSSTSTESL
jgi:hypothetical protein